jgi:hyperosmotically inducible protein
MNAKLRMTCLIASLALAPAIAMSAEMSGGMSGQDVDADSYDASPSPSMSANPSTSTTSTIVKDSAITAKIKAKFAEAKLASVSRINVDTDANGIVWLSGTAVNQSEIDKAVAIARSTAGVISVKNSLKVQGQS